MHTWDSVLTFRSGRVVYLHPNYIGTAFSANLGKPLPDAEVPTTGMGGTDGKGTYKRFKCKGYDSTLRFRK